MTTRCPINGERLWRTLMEMAEIGATERGGSCRLALTDADRAGRERFMAWAAEAGYSMQTDALGNLWVRRPGSDDSLNPVVMGSHLDTQPTGGRFDGVLGVLAGLEVLRSLDDHGITTRHPVEVAVWMNEEGSRFSPPMMGSGVWSGAFDAQEVLDKIGQDGARLGDELARLGWTGMSRRITAPTPRPPASSCTSSRARCSRTPAAPSAWSPAPRASTGTSSPSPARRPMPAPPPCTCAGTRWWAPPGWWRQ
ncbi:MAG: M20/M25/M40 family metallo-hydrolase [Arhodomonas sp.]|nr:M20/M25/M40 family metallo-hydrolase [Arhodomonas sp.]